MNLDEFCLQIVARAKVRGLYFADFLLLLYQTGIRFSERERELWHYESVTTFKLDALKNNNQRTISRLILPLSFVSHIYGESIPAYNVSFSTFNRQLKFLQPAKIKVVGEKDILSHIFRHNFAKRLKTEGYNDVMIQSIMAEKHLSSAQHYIYSDISIIA